jgi:hypothetical protein
MLISLKLTMPYEELVKTQPEHAAREEHREGPVARSIEQQTAKLPSDVFLWASFGSVRWPLS